MERHALACAARHRALGDARVLWDFWSKLREDLPAERLEEAVETLLGATALPPQLPADLADDLPEGPGVYRFFGEGEVLLYIGKSVSLRTRVLGHFAGEHSDSKEQRLARQVRRVDWLETAGELGALLREAEWIKTERPLYNRRLKTHAESLTILADEGVRFLPIDGVDPRALSQCFGLFRSRKDANKVIADIARAQSLCLKALGLEPGPGSCFAYQLGRCRGACVGREAPALHALRLKLALASLRLKDWPFAGRIALREQDGNGGADLHVCDAWSYIGTARSAAELEDLRAAPTPHFDVDVYRILARYLAQAGKLDWHDLQAGAECV
jgi:DNA polymerase-3 subunit epsilon